VGAAVARLPAWSRLAARRRAPTPLEQAGGAPIHSVPVTIPSRWPPGQPLSAPDCRQPFGRVHLQLPPLPAGCTPIGPSPPARRAARGMSTSLSTV